MMMNAGDAVQVHKCGIQEGADLMFVQVHCSFSFRLRSLRLESLHCTVLLLVLGSRAALSPVTAPYSEVRTW